MIIKSKSYKNKKAFQTVVKYILKDNNEILLTRFLRGKNLSNEEITRQLYKNEQYRVHKRSNSVKLFMEILSFHKDDAEKLTDRKLKQIARKYISLRANQSIALATIHRDKDHTHLHILLSGVEYRTGKSIRMAREEYKEMKLQMEAFQTEKFPELQRSSINHTKKAKKKSRL